MKKTLSLGLVLLGLFLVGCVNLEQNSGQEGGEESSVILEPEIRTVVIKEQSECPESTSTESGVVIDIQDIDTPLKELQIKYITGQISEQEYLTRERELIGG